MKVQMGKKVIHKEKIPQIFIKDLKFYNEKIKYDIQIFGNQEQFV